MKVFVSTAWIFFVSVSVGATEPPPSKLQGMPASAENQRRQPIGSAKMFSDHSIILTLRAETDGAIGDAQFIYKPSDQKYAEIVRHVGGLKPGKEKIVLPFPEKREH